MGTASGRAFVKANSSAKYFIASGLADGFRGWIDGRAVDGPRRALCPAERRAASAVVLAWAISEQGEFTAGSAPADGGTNLVDYLKTHGVR